MKPTMKPTSSPPGSVTLVGAGPGDPELLTLKALRRLQAAQVVLFDRLVSPEIMDMVNPSARRVFVGKRCGKHYVTQRQTERLMVYYARQSLNVVRLKGGDPFVFGRGGEEMQALAAAGVKVEVVPGITAAMGCGASAGIPLTHRDYAHACVFVTAHGTAGAPVEDWAALARPGQTLAVYMGLSRLGGFCEGLIEHGLPPDWPVALIEHGTTADQRVVTGCLADIAGKAGDAGLGSPMLAIIGEVVRLRREDSIQGSAARGLCPAAS